jgi:hypothetical protein
MNNAFIVFLPELDTAVEVHSLKPNPIVAHATTSNATPERT